MALVVADRVQETSTTAGTGTLSLSGAVAGNQTFASGVGVGNTTYYALYDQTAQVWEVGLGTVGSGTLARTTVLANSSGTTSPLNLAGNSVVVWCDYPAEKAVYKDASGNVTLGGALNVTGTTTLATSLTGILKAASGVVSTAVSGTDYAPATSGTSILKGNGAGGFSSAVSGTDYAPATSGSAILYGNGSGGFSSVTIGSGVSFVGGTLSATGTGGTVTTVSVVSANGLAGTVANPTTTPAITLSTSVSGILKGNGTGISAAVAGTDYVPTSGTGATGTWGISISGNAATATSTPKLSTYDLRSTALTPSYFGQGVSTAFMANSTDGLSDGGIYHGVIQFQQWTDSSGGGAAEIAITDSNNLWHRGSGGGLTSWSPWVKLLDSGNYSSYSNFGTNAVYGGIYYDGSNTAYYADPAGASIFNGLKLVDATNDASGTDAALWIQGSNNDWAIIVDKTSYDYGIYANLASSHTYAYRALKAGSEYYRVGTDLSYHNASFRAPIFYDFDDTNYYLNPNGGSRLNETYTTQSYTYGWFRNYGAQGLYNQDYGNHWYADGAYWNVAYGGATGIRLRVTGHAGTVAGYYYGDTSLNSGLLNQSGSWKVRVNAADTEIYDYLYWNDGRGYIFYDRNNTGYYCDPASTSNFNVLYVGGTQLTAGVGQGQSWQNVTASRAKATNYTNSTGKPIEVIVTSSNSSGVYLAATVGGVVVGEIGGGSGTTTVKPALSFVVPNGVVYSCSGTGALTTWTELR